MKSWFSKTPGGPQIWSVEGRDKHTGEDRRSVVVAPTKKQAAEIAHGRGVVVSSLKAKAHAPPPPAPPQDLIQQLSDSTFGSSATLEPGDPSTARVLPTPPPMPVIPLPREEALATVLASSPEKYLYHEDYAKCLTRIIRFVLAIYGTGPARRGTQTLDPLQTLLDRFHFDSLFPGHTLDPKKARKALMAAAEQTDPQSIAHPSAVFDWDFMFERHLRELIPAEALSPAGKARLTYAEVTCVFQSVRRLLRRHKRKCALLGCPDASDGWRQIPHRYFLGPPKRSDRKPRPNTLAKMTPQDAWDLAFRAGHAAGLTEGLQQSGEPTRDYPKRFRRKTGRTLTAPKLSAIFKLLDQHGLLLKREVPSPNNPNCLTNAFKLGPHATFEISFNLFKK